MSTIFESALNQVPNNIERFVDKSFDLSDIIIHSLKQKGKDQKFLADQLGKKESEISKWLRGNHNFTLKTIAKIESVLGEDIIKIPKPNYQPQARIVSLHRDDFFKKDKEYVSPAAKFTIKNRIGAKQFA